MLYPLIMCIVVIGLAQEAAAADIDTSYLRGSNAYEVTGTTYPVHQVAAPLYPTSVPAPSDLPIFNGPLAPAPPAWFWTGFYGGGHVGTAAGTANFGDPFGSSIFGDNVTTPGLLAGGQVGYNWQMPTSNLVLGVEADASWVSSDGTNTCLAYSGFFVSANCRVRPQILGDLTARVGWAYGYFNHSLIYVKGGAAFVRNKVDITTNNTPILGLAPLATSSNLTAIGWTVGAGVEHAITPAWSVRLEYAYAGFGSQTASLPPGLVQSVPPAPLYSLTPASATRVAENFQEVSLGLNYKFGAGPSAPWSSAAPFVGTPVAFGWEMDLGARYWFSSGIFQKDLVPPSLVSRLTYNAMGNSGELFGRIEAPQNVFLKGNIGLGSLLRGQLNDEDWVIFGDTVAYSNTVSSVQGDIDYATLDLGYDLFRAAGYKLGAFVGYNYYRENKSAYGCTQIANAFSDCATAVPNSVLQITEDDAWQSLRVGFAGEIMITDQLKLGADVAYLPYVRFSGVDNHLGWNPVKVFPEWSNSGQGVQLDAIMSYAITDQFSFGVGGRYWAMWTQNGEYTLATEYYCGAGCPNWPADFKTQVYGVFVQLDYRGIGSLLEGFK
ncbi:MAG TPA: outer membrane beta-barrel protein [Xanthobacteraceae bacterium]|nr:outer membrane beta-barrel protein [Xanthobacteraceae bacterium]